MRHLVFFLAALASLALITSAGDSEPKIVCYFGSWSVYRPGDGKFNIEDIQPELCTHLIYTFVGISQEGGIRVLDSWNDLEDNYGKAGFKRFNNLRKLSPNTKTLIAIGGWNEGSTKYSEVVASDTLRANFVKNAVNFIEKYGFDGLDLDWEYPCQRGGKPEDKQNFVKWVKELKAAFSQKGFLLTAAVASAEPSASLSYDIPEVSKYLDFINIMSYDLHGSWEKVTGHNAPLYARDGESGNDLKLNVDASVHYWLKNGCPPEKLIVGVPFYGRSFTLADPNKNGLGAPTTGPGTAGKYTREGGMLGYNEICENLKEGGWNVVRHEQHRSPYAYKGNQWVGYDDVTSLTEKMAYIKSLGLGGAMMWSVETDDFKGKCGEKYPLLKTMNAGLRGGIPVPTTTAPKPTDSQPTQPPTETSSTQSPPPPSGICKTAGYIRDEKNCNIFYNCYVVGDQYQVYTFKCPFNLVFDYKTNGCNYKTMVPECQDND